MSKKDSLIFSKLLALFLWTSLFTVLIFQVQVWLYGEENVVRVEDEYIEPTISDPSIGVFGTGISDEEYSDTLGVIESAKEAEYSSASELIFDFFPEHFQYSVAPETGLVRSILGSREMTSLFSRLHIEMYELLFDVRGKMKDKTVKLFGIEQMDTPEFLAVFIHEFAHYLDIYTLDKQVLQDVSYYFYNLSWDGTKIVKKGQTQADFVSGYAMTNKYEDFAESFTYYVLHNRDFTQKMETSEVLQKKYQFFQKYVFRDETFQNTSFVDGPHAVKEYYRDITKIPFSSTKLLQYLKTEI